MRSNIMKQIEEIIRNTTEEEQKDLLKYLESNLLDEENKAV